MVSQRECANKYSNVDGGQDDETGSNVSTFDTIEPDDEPDNEELIHARMHCERQRHRHRLRAQQFDQQQNRDQLNAGHRKELIKPDFTERLMRARPPSAIVDTTSATRRTVSASQQSEARIATAVDEEQLQRRLQQQQQQQQSESERFPIPGQSSRVGTSNESAKVRPPNVAESAELVSSSQEGATSSPPTKNSSSSSSASSIATNNNIDNRHLRRPESPPPPMKIIIPASVARSISQRANHHQQQSTLQLTSAKSASDRSASAGITHDYGSLLRSNEIQVLYRAPVTTELDRNLKGEQAKQVAPNLRQSPIAIMSVNPSYALQNKPLRIEYPATVENLRLNNTGFSWEVKLPYQVSMTTALYGAHLQATHRYRLDQFHCHWGRNEQDGSEHTVDSRSYSAELHFVHYNMDKYHTLSKAARHPDGLVVVSVFLDAHDDHHNHAELEKICNNLKSVQLRGEHSIIKQAIRIENLLPNNRSFWSYQGSLTTPPYLESVTWFVLKQPIICNTNQIRRFRSLKSALRHSNQTIGARESVSSNSSTKNGHAKQTATDDEEQDSDDSESSVFIKSNHRKTQPLNGRTIVTYDE